MRRLIVTTFLLSILSMGDLYAQMQGQAIIDSLLKELPKQKEDTNKVNVLGDLSISYNSVNPNEGIKYGQHAMALATKLKWKKGMGWASHCLAVSYQRKSDYPRALEYSFEELKIVEEIGYKTGIAAAMVNIGNVYQKQAQNTKALEYYLKSLNLYEEIRNKSGIAATTLSIGNIYRSQKDYSAALEYYSKSLELFEETRNKKGIANSTFSIGLTYSHLGNYAAGIAYLQLCCKMAQETGLKVHVARSLGAIGNCFLSIINDSSAKSANAYGTTELPINRYQPTAVIPVGKTALLAAAIKNMLQSLAISREIHALDMEQSCYSDLALAYKLKADYKKAMEYADSSRAIKDSIFSKENNDKIAALENSRREYGDSLKSAAAQKAADIKETQRRNYELIGGGVLVLSLGFIFVVTRKNRLLDNEKKQSDNLLLNILPEEVASQLKNTGKSAAKQYDHVTVMFTDFVNFTEASERMSAEALVEELDTCFKVFDEIIGKHNIEKIKTIGDAYLAVCGLPTADPRHAENVIKAAKEISAFMLDRAAKLGNRTFDVRIGIHSGNVVAGIVGVKKFAYDIWGDTVNTAARMEQNSEAGKINISQTTYELVKDKFTYEYRGEVKAKGKGVMKMYFVG